MSVTRFLAGFAVGALIGAVAGVLLAPKSGEETREMLGDMATDISKKTDARVKDIQKKAEDIVSDVQEKSEEIMSKLSDMLGKKDGAES
ncbi:MAG: YtxH domain-containing protein [bacterium]|nr:YtxH domain-containing protein [bacterium]